MIALITPWRFTIGRSITTVEPGSIKTGISARRTKYIADGSPHAPAFKKMLKTLDGNEREVKKIRSLVENKINPLEPQFEKLTDEQLAAKTVEFDYYNTQGQQQFVWPASFALAGAYLDQLERSGGLSADRIASARQALSGAESASGAARQQALTDLATQLDGEAGSSSDADKVRLLES